MYKRYNILINIKQTKKPSDLHILSKPLVKIFCITDE